MRQNAGVERVTTLTTSEYESQPKLYLPAWVRRCDYTEGWTGTRAGGAKDRCIREVDELGKELKVRPLRNLKCLDDAQVRGS